MCVIYSTEADESNGSVSSEEDLDYSKTFSLKETVPKKSISQIIKDKKKQTHLTLQWYSLAFINHVQRANVLYCFVFCSS